jgi:diguanylate cyclase (GGDEF)-like protein
MGIFSDISMIKKTEENLIKLAHFDPLTSLPNCILFMDRLESGIAMSQREKTTLALLFLDLDGFKVINDTLGHRVGDDMLKEVSDRLKACLIRDIDTVSRLGGDEFTFILNQLDKPEHASIIADRILNSFSQPFLLGSQELKISASIGISIYNRDSQNAEEMIKNADTAMYYAKGKGKNNCQFYAPELNMKNHERLNFENRIHLGDGGPCQVDRP